jgi:hypothetical protein
LQIRSAAADTTHNIVAGDTTATGGDTTVTTSWLEGTWKMVKEVEMPDHGADTIIHDTGCDVQFTYTFEQGTFVSHKNECETFKEATYHYKLAVDINSVDFFKIGCDKVYFTWEFTSHTDSTYFQSSRGGYVWVDRYFKKQE